MIPTETSGISDQSGRQFPCYALSLARDAQDVQDARRLRSRVFVQEAGARLDTPPSGLGTDGFDPYCDHLLARETATGELVATCRLLPPEGAAAAGRLVAEADFDLSGLAVPRGELVEISRACLHPAHRGGTLVPLLALGVAAYATRRGLAWAGGNCLAPGQDRERTAAVLWAAAARHSAPPDHRAVPRHPLPPPRTAAGPDPALLPPLVRGSLSLGAWVCGPPGWSPRFGTAAVYVLHSLRRIDPARLRQLPDLSADF